MSVRTVAITGSDGFIGRNLRLRLAELGHRVIGLNRQSSSDDWIAAVARADTVFHLAGANRPDDPADFDKVNAGTASLLAEAVVARDEGAPPISIIYASSIRAQGDDVYGRSKKAGEDALLELSAREDVTIYIFRLPNVFGKWARPNYNSAVATFCHNTARDMDITVHDPAAPLRLIYIDDLILSFVEAMEGAVQPGFTSAGPVYETTVGEVADIIRGFRRDRNNSVIGEVGIGLTRALYATYVASLEPGEFSYPIESHRDPRGAFSEMLKTRSSGQFSYFTALPGVTRGGHYHHTKTEKFLILHGDARFGFRHVDTGETHEIFTSGEAPVVVQTVPGWTHDVTNVGEGILIAMLWANEIFDREKPDTIPEKV